MNPLLRRMLQEFLLRTAWLYGIAGLAQFLLTQLYWTKGFARVSVPGVLLGVWGFTAAIDARSLVWRSLPLTRREASIYRWWAMAGVPALGIAVCDCLAWAAQRTSPGLPAPSPGSLLGSVLLGWAALGAMVVLPFAVTVIRGRWGRRFAIVLVAGYSLGLIYGLPAYVASPAAAIGFAVIGLSLVTYAGIEAARGRLWQWSEFASGDAGKHAQYEDRPVRSRFGAAALVLPLLRRTLMWAVAATGGVMLLYRFFPGAGRWLFWSYFLAISAAGFLNTYHARAAIQILRILPFSAGQLAFRLQLFGALPGIVTLGLALLVNATVLHLKLDLMQFAALGLIAIASQALPISAARNARVSAAFLKWIGLLQRLWVPLYMGIVVMSYDELWTRFWWFRWPLTVAGLVLCVVGYFTLVQQLRAGIRPMSNEGAFSAR